MWILRMLCGRSLMFSVVQAALGGTFQKSAMAVLQPQWKFVREIVLLS